MESPKNLLFVCYANERRSPTAELVFRQLLTEAGEKGVNLDSAGIDVNPQSYTVKQMTQNLGDLADKIFTFSHNLELAIAIQYNQPFSKIINLCIADRWAPCHPELMKELREKLQPYVNQWYR